MGKINKKQVKHIAKLANLDISNEEMDDFAPQLSDVLDYISELDEVDTKNTEPTSQTTGLVNKRREDEVNESRIIPEDEATSQADKNIDNYFAVDMVLKEKDLT